jgi:uncharacterized protein (UPF0218 family)
VISIWLLTSKLRTELKAPLGLLVQGSSKRTMERLKKIVNETKPAKIIAVGDRISENLIKSGLLPDTVIVDNKIMRKPVAPLKFDAEKTFNVINPAGTITDETYHTVGKAINFTGRTKVIVDGEEDLLTLAAVLSAPKGSIVVYGQPRMGIVIVSVSEDSKIKFRKIVNRMEYKDSKG